MGVLISAAKYPAAMLRDCKDGFVDFRFTVDEQEFVHDAFVVDHDVKTRITFTIDN